MRFHRWLWVLPQRMKSSERRARFGVLVRLN